MYLDHIWMLNFLQGFKLILNEILMDLIAFNLILRNNFYSIAVPVPFIDGLPNLA